MSERIVVGMSGGVDSSVAAALLVEQGVEVIGVTLRVWPWREPESRAAKFGSCCSPESVDDARQVARRLGIPYYLLNTEREFDRTVIEKFAREYEAGGRRCPASSAIARSSSARCSTGPVPGMRRRSRPVTTRGSRATRPRGATCSGAAAIPEGSVGLSLAAHPGPARRGALPRGRSDEGGGARQGAVNGPRHGRQAGEPGDLLHSRTMTTGGSCATVFPARFVRAPSSMRRAACSGSIRASSTTRSVSAVASAWPGRVRSTSRRSIAAQCRWWWAGPARSRPTGSGPSR